MKKGLFRTTVLSMISWPHTHTRFYRPRVFVNLPASAMQHQVGSFSASASGSCDDCDLPRNEFGSYGTREPNGEGRACWSVCLYEDKLSCTVLNVNWERKIESQRSDRRCVSVQMEAGSKISLLSRRSRTVKVF